MLFHVEHVHTHETCPGVLGDPELVRKTFGTVVSDEHTGRVGVKLRSSYADAPAHTTFFIIEADSAEKVGAFLLPLMKLGSARIRPVTDLVEEVKRKIEETKRT
nr:hypothetical protein [Candidatus Njordarchaeum guaymaensis]